MVRIQADGQGRESSSIVRIQAKGQERQQAITRSGNEWRSGNRRTAYRIMLRMLHTHQRSSKEKRGVSL